jgi:diguanylate cyclase (GGDEF)-like protein
VSRSMLERLQRLPRVAVLLLGLALIAGIAWLDNVTGPKLLLNVFYLLPVMLVAWVTASTAYGLLAVLATFLVGPLETYRDGFGFYSLPVAAWNAGMRTAVFCIVLLLLAEVRKLVARLQEQSLTDELTGLANRRAFLDVAAREIERSRRYRHELSLAYLDIDAFKAANDRFGHAVGGRVLIALAGLARATARSVDTVARIGGDEFVILMPETDAPAALPLAERLRTTCSRAAGTGAAPVTCSIGVVTFERAPSDLEELLTSADALMYEAKAAGGDGVRHARVGAPRSTATDGRLLPFAHRTGA